MATSTRTSTRDLSLSGVTQSGASLKPALRGVLHQWAAVISLLPLSLLVALAPPGAPTDAAALFSASLLAMFIVSAVYHRPTWSFRARTWWRRADHAAIYLLIAGTYTPVCLLGLPEDSRGVLLTVVWVGAGLGWLQSLFWANASKWVGALCGIALGGAVLPWIDELWRSLGTANLLLLAVGAIVYALGAVAYALRRPNPVPGVFGYHEVFHACTIVAGALHFALVAKLVAAAGG